MTTEELTANFKALRIAQKAFFAASHGSEAKRNAFNQSRRLERIIDAELFREADEPTLFEEDMGV